jgi:tetratricopeptide (TPR) repeat protein
MRQWIRALWKHRILTILGILLIALVGLVVYLAGWQIWFEYHYRIALAESELSQPTRTPTYEVPSHLTAAAAHFAKCLEVRPTSAELHLLAARVARRLGAYDDAERHLSQSQKLGGVAEAISLERLLIEAQRGEMTKVEGFLTACINKEHPDTVLILEAMTYGYMKTYQMASALECLNAWLKLQPDAVQALIWRGSVQRLVSRYLEAADDYRRALELEPENQEARQGLAELLIYSHRPEEALQHFDYLHERRPDNAAITLGLARCQIELGKLQEGKQLLDQLLESQPENVQALAESGKLALDMQQFEEAEGRLRKALRLSPNERETLYSLYRCLIQQKKVAEAQQFNQELDRVEKDIGHLKEVARQIMVDPHNAGLRCEAGNIMIANGQDREGLRWLASALQEDPNHVATHQSLAKYYQQVGNPELAARHRQLALQSEVSGLKVLPAKP